MSIISIRPNHVPRDKDVWRYTDRPIPVQPPTLQDRILGQRFIETCTVMNIPWQGVLLPGFDPFSKGWQSIVPSAGGAIEDDDNFVFEHNSESQTTLLDLFEDAVQEVFEYYCENGEIDDPYGPGTREPQIGDTVQFLRKSTDNLDLLYGEPTEDRISRPPAGVEFDPSRYDGDARWSAQNLEVWYEGPSGPECLDLYDPETRRAMAR